MFQAIAQFRQRLQQGEFLIGAAVTITDPRVSEALADSVDFLWYDMEHTTLSPEALAAHLIAARGKNKAALVRVQSSATPFIKSVLDAGADGIVVPQVTSVEEVQSIVDDCRYPPTGRRGFGPLVPTNYGRIGDLPYIEAADANIFAAVMIETAAAVEAIEQIVAIDGLDSIVIGPWDLSGSLGHLGQVDHPSVVEAIEHVIATTHNAGKFVGSGMPAAPNFAYTQARRGVHWAQLGVDCSYLTQFMDQAVTDIRQKLAD